MVLTIERVIPKLFQKMEQKIQQMIVLLEMTLILKKTIHLLLQKLKIVFLVLFVTKMKIVVKRMKRLFKNKLFCLYYFNF